MESRLRYIILISAIACIAALRVTAQIIKPGNTSYEVELWLKADSVQNTPPTDGASVNAWSDKSGKELNFVQRNSDPVPVYMQRGAFNFQPSLFWSATSGDRNLTLTSNTAFTPNATKSYYIFTVSKPYGSSRSYSTPIVCLYPRNSISASGVYWIGTVTGTDLRVTTGFNTTERATGSTTNGFTATDQKQGLISWIVPNNSTNSGDIAAIYLNGKKSPYWDGTGTNGVQSGRGSNWVLHTTAQKIQLGQAGTGNNYPFSGEIMEVIILSTSGNTTININELGKIQSYLAIKYGLELKKADGSAQDNIVNSDNTPVWNIANGTGVHADNATYSHNVFGIGRDDASGLNQKQSQSINDKQLAVALGAFATSNTLNTNTFIQNKTFLMLGSNGLAEGREAYKYNSANTYLSGALADSVNFRSATVWKASIMTNGTAGGSMTNISMEVNKSPVRQAKYLLVGSDPAFAPANTRIYSLSDFKAGNVTVYDGDYIAFAWYSAAAPGGATGAGTYMAWLTPDSYDKATGWANLIEGSGVGNFNAQQTAPDTVNSGYNYHPAVEFKKTSNGNATNRLVTAVNANITSGQNVTAIFVYKRENAKFNNDCMFSFSNSNYFYSLAFYNSSSNNDMYLYWPNTSGAKTILTNAPTGIITVDNANNNSTASQVYSYLNGNLATTVTVGQGGVSAPWKIGSDGVGEYGFEGTIQEIIILNANGTGNHVAPADLQKIHSYLAIKYGISLENGNNTGANYINSDGNIVWNRTDNNKFNNNIFGIGRDDAAGLNQVQSRSQNTDMLTLYKGTLNTLNDNSSKALENKTFLMLGSNGLAGDSIYNHPANTNFAGINNTEKLNYRSATVYKAQVTGISTINVNIEVVSPTAKYILVSTDSTFSDLPNTRIYPITNMKAGVVINDGDYVTLAGYRAIPGGALDAGEYMAWLTPDSYNKTTGWTNVIKGINTTGNFIQPTNWSKETPPEKATGQNFHPAVQFRPVAYSNIPNRMQSEKGINLTTDDAFTFILVYKATNAGFDYQNILHFGGGNEYSTSNYALGYNNNNNNRLSLGWTTSLRTLGAVPFGATTLVTVDNNNGQVTTTNGIRHYLNGSQIAQANTVIGSVNNQIVLCGSYYDLKTTGARGANADIQEIIILKRPKATSPFLANVNSGIELNKIHSYLAIKYGITLNSSDYVNSDGITVWDRAANNGYNHNIFGIGRDDLTALYQKQSRSDSSSMLTAYIGAKLETLNSQNNGTFANDKIYLMFGSKGGEPIQSMDYFNVNDSVYEDGKKVELVSVNIQSPVYKTQLTGATPLNVNLRVATVDFNYALVSKVEDFECSQTKLYPVASLSAMVEIDNAYKYIKFIGFSPGPGGVSEGLCLWLRADDETALTIDNRPASDAAASGNNLTGYPDVNGAEELPAVSEWKDLVRKQTYSYDAAGTTNNHRIPVLKKYSPEMNYHPAVRFWANSSYSSYLSNNATNIMGYDRPSDGKHTAYFMVNCKLNASNPWVYMLCFGGASINGPTQRPGYGVDRLSNGITGRFRVQSSQPKGSKDLFKEGATSILGYQTRDFQSGSNNIVYFRFNGVDDNNSSTEKFDWSNVYFNNSSMLGGLYAHDRTINGVMSEVILFNKQLDDTQIQKVESFLAFKYGVTLEPSNTPTKRFDYTLSNNTVLWKGNTEDGKFKDFYHNIAAVIRDDAARLNNRHSHSTNIGSLLHIGVAGTELSDDGSNVGELENDLEAVIFGDDGNKGNSEVSIPCVDFNDRFNRIWLIHKATKDDRPIPMLIGAQDNQLLTIGDDAITKADYYSKLGAGYKLYLIIADSPDSITQDLYRATIPMTYINGEHQCTYTLSQQDTYVTFGWKQNTEGGCYSNIRFEEKKQFTWRQWDNKTNPATVTGPKTFGKGEVDLGDGIKVDTTFIAFDSGIVINRGFPVFSSSPKDGIKIRRSKGSIDPSNRVTTVIKFNSPVLPDFSISQLDSRSWNCDEVTITGYCGSSPVIPHLTYAGDPAKAPFEIKGNKATVTKNKAIYNPADKNGTLDVAFEYGGIDSLVIYYNIKNKVSTAQEIYISPINLRQTPPPPVINEDGLSFSKEVEERSITSCDNAEYSFYIQNTNCEEKYVFFSDTLPPFMTWKAESLGLDSINGLSNFKMSINKYAGSDVLAIDSLLIPCGSTIKLTATAEMDEEAPSGEYKNRSAMTYRHIKNNVESDTLIFSVDRETHADYTVFYSAEEERLDTVKLTAVSSIAKYLAGDTIEVTLTIDNHNIPITDSYMSVEWDAGFTYVENSITADDIENKHIIAPYPDNSPETFFIMSGEVIGEDGSEEGFTLPVGTTTIKFKLAAPAVERDLVFDRDLAGIPTGLISPLNVYYEFSTAMDDACLIKSISELTGTLEVPSLGVKHIFVDEKATGLNNGTSWDDAFLRFADAVEVANNYPLVDSIFVAKGVYKPVYLPAGAPSSVSQFNVTFNLPDSVKIFGGFNNKKSGTEYDLDDRPNKDYTILSGGDGGNNDIYHVLTAIHSQGVEIDGFSITAGYAAGGNSLIINDVAVRRDYGGGAYIADTASVVLRNMNFHDNRASSAIIETGGGGAIYSTRKSSVTIENSTFSNNSGNTFGGSIFNDSASVINARNLTFKDDRAQVGGSIANFAVFNLDSASITNVSAQSGAAIYSAGITNINRLIVEGCLNTTQNDTSIIYSGKGDRLLLSNTLIRENKGGIIVGENTLDSLINCTLAGNDKAAIVLEYSTSNITVVNSIIYGNTVGVEIIDGNGFTQKYSLVQGKENTNDGNISGSTDPRFSDPKFYSTESDKTYGNYHTQIGSPIVNKGNDVFVEGRFLVDLDGATRIMYKVDMGAYEEQSDHVEIKRVVPDFGPNIGGRYTNNSSTGNPYGIDTTSTGFIFLLGEGFNHGIASITFGGVPASFTWINDETITCVPPVAPSDPAQWIVNDTISYDPHWNEGVVKITLTTNSDREDTIYYRYRHPIVIDSISPNNGPLTGGTQVKIFGHNFLPHDGSGSDNTAVVFSLLPSDADLASANIISIVNDTIIVTTAAHPVNYVAVTVDNAREKTSLTGNPQPFAYYPTTYIINGKWSEAHKWEEQTIDNILPYPGADIYIKANCEQDIDVDMDSITVYQGKAYTLNAGKTLDANVFTLKDDASFLNNGNMNAQQQHLEHLLIKGRNWYVSSPVQGYIPPSIEKALGTGAEGGDLTTGNVDLSSASAESDWRVEWYDETGHNWERLQLDDQFTTGLGYTVYSKNEDIAVRFSGKYTDGDQTPISLTRQNDSHPKRGFNLVGNPFPSYWRWTADNTQANNLYGTIWYRTNVVTPPADSTYQFWAYNASGNVSAAPGWENETQASPYSLAYIPPMQAFWVRVKDGQISGTLTFNNSRRAHSNHSSNILKSAEAPENETRPLLRLTLIGGGASDETVIYADPAAQAGFDDYDSEKMFAGTGAEMFTLPNDVTGKERHELVINGLPKITDGTEIPIGFQANETGSFSFRAREILNLDMLDVILKDKWRKEEFNLRSGNSYNFTSGSATNTERFSIVFRYNGTDTSPTPETVDNLLVYSNKAGRIIVLFQDEKRQGKMETVSVYDVTGRKIAMQTIVVGERAMLKVVLRAGVYVLRAGNHTAEIVVN